MTRPPIAAQLKEFGTQVPNIGPNQFSMFPAARFNPRRAWPAVEQARMLNAAQPELFVLLKLSTIICVFSLW